MERISIGGATAHDGAGCTALQGEASAAVAAALQRESTCVSVLESMQGSTILSCCPSAQVPIYPHTL